MVFKPVLSTVILSTIALLILLLPVHGIDVSVSCVQFTITFPGGGGNPIQTEVVCMQTPLRLSRINYLSPVQGPEVNLEVYHL